MYLTHYQLTMRHTTSSESERRQLLEGFLLEEPREELQRLDGLELRHHCAQSTRHDRVKGQKETTIWSRLG